MATKYTINYDDQRFQDVESAKQEALNNVNNMYNSMTASSDEYYQKQIDAAQQYADTTTANQQANTDFMIEKINQQKEQAEKDYTKEQKGAYVDYMKQTNQYGATAQGMANQGLQNSGYSESSMVGMYNTYQNRVATARESYNQAVLNYNNSIKEAQLANNEALAEIAYKALQTQLELSLEGFQYKNTLLQQQYQAQVDTENRYYTQWQNVLSQMNTENALAEQVRQYNESLAEQQRQYNTTLAYQKERAKVADAQWQKEYDLAKKASSSSRTYSSGGGGSASGSGSNPYSTTSQTTSLNTSKITTSTTIKTNYYNGKATKDQVSALNKYGAYKSSTGQNYQPKGVIINGKDYGALSKTGYTAGDWTANKNIKNSSGVSVAGQNVFKSTANGKTYYWIWNGSKMCYEEIGKYMPRLSNSK